MDNTIPLPIDNLKSRYSALFSNISNGISGCFVGTLKSPKSGYIKYILENRDWFEDILPRDTKLIFFEPTYVVSNSPYSWIHQLNLAIQFQDSSYRSIVSEDVSVIISNIQKYIYENKSKGIRTSFLINKLDMLRDIDGSSGAILNTFYNTLKNTPDNACTLTFFLSNYEPVNDSLFPFISQLEYPVRESVIYFPDLDLFETKYTIDRLSLLYKLKLEKGIVEDLFNFSGGNYSLIYDAIQIASDEKKNLTRKYLKKVIRTHPIILKYLTSYLESLSYQKRISLVKENNFEFFKYLGVVDYTGEIKSDVLREYVSDLGEENIANPSLGIFTQNERIVVNFLKENMDKVVERDVLADVIWEKENESRYSLWAMDKYISRLRRKISISNPNLKLVSVRKKGVMLCH